MARDLSPSRSGHFGGSIPISIAPQLPIEEHTSSFVMAQEKPLLMDLDDDKGSRKRQMVTEVECFPLSVRCHH